MGTIGDIGCALNEASPKAENDRVCTVVYGLQTLIGSVENVCLRHLGLSLGSLQNLTQVTVVF
jgi:hypothetical protein